MAVAEINRQLMIVVVGVVAVALAVLDKLLYSFTRRSGSLIVVVVFDCTRLALTLTPAGHWSRPRPPSPVHQRQSCSPGQTYFY